MKLVELRVTTRVASLPCDQTLFRIGAPSRRKPGPERTTWQARGLRFSREKTSHPLALRTSIMYQ